MALNMPTFYKRTGSAIVFAAVMLTGLLWDSPWPFLALICIINVLCIKEFFALLEKMAGDEPWPVWLHAGMQVLSLFLLVALSLPSGINPLQQPTNLVFALLPLVAPLLLMAATLPTKNVLPQLLKATGALFYITLPLILLAKMRQFDILLPMAIIALIWINDTMAYIVGSFIGKTPFSPISPKKTWEGTGGGALLTIIAAGIYGYLPVLYTIHDSTLTDWMAIALCVAVAGTLGDLLESKLKRLADVKDSGAIMPGHGGALDRFDSLLIAIPVVYVYFTFFM